MARKNSGQGFVLGVVYVGFYTGRIVGVYDNII